MELIVLKIGGSAITNKEAPFSFRENIVENISNEFYEIYKENKYNFIIVHGGGSFGHPLAKKYQLKSGIQNIEEQAIGFSLTHLYMTKLNTLIIEKLISKNLPVVTVQTSAVAVTNDGKISYFCLNILKKLLEFHMIPVMFGDVVLDEKKGFTILSGDDIAVYLAIRLKATKLLFGLDIDGIYTKDPSLEDSRLLTSLKISSVSTIKGRTSGFDVTGGIFHKIRVASQAVKKGVKVYFFNITEPGRLTKVINGKGIFTELVLS